MTLRSDDGHPRYFPEPVTPCAQCGKLIFVSSWSEFVDDRRINYLWECNACNYSFETLVCFAEPMSEAA